MNRRKSILKIRITQRFDSQAPFRVWTPNDFVDVGSRDSVDKTLQRLAHAGAIRRIDRGLYDKPRVNLLTGKLTGPDYRQIIDAVARRDKARMLVDGMTAANDLGLSDAVPSRVVVHTDAHRRVLRLGHLDINFKAAAPSKLYWANRPAMRLVQALHWLRDLLPQNRDQIMARLRTILDDPKQGPSIRNDLKKGFSKLPIWMQEIVRELIPSDDSMPVKRKVVRIRISTKGNRPLHAEARTDAAADDGDSIAPEIAP